MAFSNSPSEKHHNIMQSRIGVDFGDAGTQVALMILSNPTSWYNDKLDASVDIYNTNGCKLNIVNSDYYKQLIAQAEELEIAKDNDGAELLYQKARNASQITFNVINRDGMANSFVQNQIVIGIIEAVEVVDKDANGKPTGTTHQSLSFNKPYAEPVKMRKTAKQLAKDTPVTAAKPAGTGVTV